MTINTLLLPAQPPTPRHASTKNERGNVIQRPGDAADSASQKGADDRAVARIADFAVFEGARRKDFPVPVGHGPVNRLDYPLHFARHLLGPAASVAARASQPFREWHIRQSEGLEYLA